MCSELTCRTTTRPDSFVNVVYVWNVRVTHARHKKRGASNARELQEHRRPVRGQWSGEPAPETGCCRSARGSEDSIKITHTFRLAHGPAPTLILAMVTGAHTPLHYNRHRSPPDATEMAEHSTRSELARGARRPFPLWAVYTSASSVSAAP
jgi:hypothetical protein